jgi:hypothetical protein
MVQIYQAVNGPEVCLGIKFVKLLHKGGKLRSNNKDIPGCKVA